jgi:hypothetical protein
MTATPFFNAVTERFVKDWEAAHICVVVRDSRMRESDPIVGMVFFKVRDDSADLSCSDILSSCQIYSRMVQWLLDLGPCNMELGSAESISRSYSGTLFI